VQLGLSARRLARLSGVSNRMIALVERQAAVPTVDRLARLADSLEYRLPQLFTVAERRQRHRQRRR